MKSTLLQRTTRCGQPHSIGDAWLSVEGIHKDEDGQTASVAYKDPSRPSPHGDWFHRGALILLGVRREIFPGVHVTIKEGSTRHRISLRIEAPANVPVTKGFPYQRGPRLVYSAD